MSFASTEKGNKLSTNKGWNLGGLQQEILHQAVHKLLPRSQSYERQLVNVMGFVLAVTG